MCIKKNGVFWDITPRGSFKEPTFRGNLVPPSSGYLFVACSVSIYVKVVPISLILVTLMMEGLSSSETLVLTRAMRRNISERPFFIVTAVKTSIIT
jgi:hypothetical protein